MVHDRKQPEIELHVERTPADLAMPLDKKTWRS
jgi:hypothetical protein